MGSNPILVITFFVILPCLSRDSTVTDLMLQIPRAIKFFFINLLQTEEYYNLSRINLSADF